MGEKTGIEWADFTINTAWGCTKVSAGCEKCYMFRLSLAFGRKADIPTPRKIENIKKDLKKIKTPSIGFLNSMTDTFHEDFSFELIDEWLSIFKDSEHIFILLTKRVNRMKKYFETREVPKNFWLGTSIENRGALHRLNTLKKIKCDTLFISFEPLLENLYEIDLKGIQWVIVGGESDSKPREFRDEWGANILAQCRKEGIPFFFKQTGGRSKNERGAWGSDEMFGKRYLEMPVKLTTKESSLVAN